jgi:hypothetical protein
MEREPKLPAHQGKRKSLGVPETICECMAHSAQDLDLAAIAIFTESGNTVRLLSKYRPEAPIYALSPDPKVVIHRSCCCGEPRPSSARASKVRTNWWRWRKRFWSARVCEAARWWGSWPARRRRRARPTLCGCIWSATGSGVSPRFAQKAKKKRRRSELAHRLTTSFRPGGQPDRRRARWWSGLRRW